MAIVSWADVKAAVADIDSVKDSVVAFVDGVIAKLQAIADAPTQDDLNAVITSLQADKAAIAAAVASGTAAEAPAPVAPVAS